MLALHEEYLVDDKGKKKAVLIPYDEWQQIIKQLEMVDDITLYDKAKNTSSDAIPFEQALREIRGEYKE